MFVGGSENAKWMKCKRLKLGGECGVEEGQSKVGVSPSSSLETVAMQREVWLTSSP